LVDDDADAYPECNTSLYPAVGSIAPIPIGIFGISSNYSCNCTYAVHDQSFLPFPVSVTPVLISLIYLLLVFLCQVFASKSKNANGQNKANQIRDALQ